MIRPKHRHYLAWLSSIPMIHVMHVIDRFVYLHNITIRLITIWRVSSQKRVNSILVNLRYFRFKLLKYKENNKTICNTFDHNFKNIPLYITRKVSIERYYVVLYNGALTLKMKKKMALNPFCDETLHILLSLCITRKENVTRTLKKCLPCTFNFPSTSHAHV